MAERIASLLSSAKRVAAQRPWPRYEIEAATWTELAERLAAGDGDLLALWAEPEWVHLALRARSLREPCIVSIRVMKGAFPSVGRLHVPAIRLERAIHDLYGIVPAGAPDLRPWLDHGAWGVRAPLGDAKRSARRDPAAYDFLAVEGHGQIGRAHV